MNQQKHVQNNKSIKKRRYSKISIATLIMGVAMLFFSCANKIEKIKEFSKSDDAPTMEAEGFEMIYSDSTIVRFKIQAKKLQNYDKEQEPFMEFPEGIEIEKYDENMSIISKITSDYARYFEKEKKWIAKNNVVVINMQGDSLITEELIWEENKELLYSEQFVKIIRKDQIITGIGFESDQEMSNWEITKVKGQIYLDTTE